MCRRKGEAQGACWNAACGLTEHADRTACGLQTPAQVICLAVCCDDSIRTYQIEYSIRTQQACSKQQAKRRDIRDHHDQNLTPAVSVSHRRTVSHRLIAALHVLREAKFGSSSPQSCSAPRAAHGRRASAQRVSARGIGAYVPAPLSSDARQTWQEQRHARPSISAASPAQPSTHSSDSC